MGWDPASLCCTCDLEQIAVLSLSFLRWELVPTSWVAVQSSCLLPLFVPSWTYLTGCSALAQGAQATRLEGLGGLAAAMACSPSASLLRGGLWWSRGLLQRGAGAPRQSAGGWLVNILLL